MPEGVDFENLVARYYGPLYEFAYSLAGSEADASDLTQQTFYIWATKGHQLRDHSKVKTWLFTTLHREFLNLRRKVVRFPHYELGEMDRELPAISPAMVDAIEPPKSRRTPRPGYRAGNQAALTLFYLEDCSYREIAEILKIRWARCSPGFPGAWPSFSSSS